MSIEDRPYIGTWRLNNQQVYRHTPDALVYINGDTALPGCPTCGGRIDLQPFITSVSVDPSVNPIATGNIALQIPRQYGDTLYRDGRFLLEPGLEVHVYMRGYFAVKGMYANVTLEQSGGVDVTKAAMFPYYLVFHGIVTEVSHEYSGGEHTASLSCADLLHFWQYQRMSTNASLFGARPHNSKVRMSLVGHNFDSMSPFGIIYTLFRDTMGAAGGVEFALGNETTADANSTALGESLFSMSLLYWQKRFQQTITKLRLYGADGTLYNSFQQAYLAGLTERGNADLPTLLSADKGTTSAQEFDPFWGHQLAKSIESGSIVEGAVSEEDSATGGAGVNITQMQAFASDISNWGQVNLFESSYETKLELANAVTEVTGFEFFQDVDGDIVYKPPFYNLDTSSSRVYRIEPLDIISFNVKEGEPEATVIKGTGSWFQNMKGTGLEGEWGTRAEYMDYRMIAKFGWRQQTFETTYFTDPRAIYYSAINRLDLHNITVNSADCTIPLRPELRPGYPVYVRHLDCFYYLQSFSHAFSYGGQCTTSLQLVAKRAKFHAPGIRPEDGRKPSINDIDLSNTFLPQLPLEVEGNEQVWKLQGFPNVVMALDPELLNPLFSIVGVNLNDLTTEQGLRTLIKAAMFGNPPVITLHETDTSSTVDIRARMFEGPYKILAGPGEQDAVIADFSTLQAELRELRKAQLEITGATDLTAAQRDEQQKQALQNASNIVALVTACQTKLAKSVPEGDTSAAYLELLNDYKSKFNPGSDMPGYYRYYSSSHPDPDQQGQRQIDIDKESGQLVSGALESSGEGGAVTCFGFSAGATDGAKTIPNVTVQAGLPIMKPGTREAIPTPTMEIHTLSFAQHTLPKDKTKHVCTGVKFFSFNEATFSGAVNLRYYNIAIGKEATLDSVVRDLFEEAFSVDTGLLLQNLPSDYTSQVETPVFDDVVGGTEVADSALGGSVEATRSDGRTYQKVTIQGFDLDEKLTFIAGEIGSALSAWAGAIFAVWQRALENEYGPEGGIPLNVGEHPTEAQVSEASQAKTAAYADLHMRWSLTEGIMAQKLLVEGTGNSRPAQTAVTRESTVSYFSPVFPVSDGRGYEVIGSYRYGRGLSIEPGGNFQRLNQVYNEDFDQLSVATVEELVQAITAQGDNSKVLGTISATARAELAAQMDITTDDLLTQTGEDLFGRQFAAYLANSKQSTQKTAAINVAYNLERLGQHARQGICECKGAEADLKLLAFSEDADPMYLEVEQPDKVSEWLSSQMVAASMPWKAAQDAMRGTVLDLNSASIVDAVSGAFGSNKALQSSIDQTGAQLAGAGQEFGNVLNPEDEG